MLDRSTDRMTMTQILKEDLPGGFGEFSPQCNLWLLKYLINVHNII